MKLQQIKADIKHHEVMACRDLDLALSVIDFEALALVDYAEQQEAGYRVADGVATVYVRGLLVPKMDFDASDWGITGYNHIAEYIERANADSTVNSIVLDIDSGGGYGSGNEAVIDAIYQSKKPIETFASGHMYSAAYWIGCSAQKITATKASGIGSIGAYIVHYEESKALEMQGIKPTLFRSGKHKAEFNSFSPLSDDEKKRLQERVNESASIFYNHVAASRDIDAKTIASWEGGDFNAQQAKDQGLIDVIASKPTTYTTLSVTTMSQEDSMDLQAALAENEKLKAEKLAAEQAKQAAEAKAQAAETKLKEAQAQAREAQIAELAELTGIEMTDEKKAAYASMDDVQFAATLDIAKSTAKATALPLGLMQEQATQGRNPNMSHEEQVMANIKARKEGKL